MLLNRFNDELDLDISGRHEIFTHTGCLFPRNKEKDKVIEIAIKMAEESFRSWGLNQEESNDEKTDINQLGNCSS